VIIELFQTSAKGSLFFENCQGYINGSPLTHPRFAALDKIQKTTFGGLRFQITQTMN
jgi:hypothetical protein